MARATYDPDLLLVGTIGRPHGLNGELTLRAHNLQGTDLSLVPGVVFDLQGKRSMHALRGARRRADGWLLRIEGVTSREEAVAFTHAEVRVRKTDLPPLAPGEFFVEDLLGCTVEAVNGRDLGTVENVFWNGAQDVMSIVGASADTAAASSGAPSEHLIPLVPRFLHAVAVDARRVVVDWEPEDVEEVPSGEDEGQTVEGHAGEGQTGDREKDDGSGHD